MSTGPEEQKNGGPRDDSLGKVFFRDLKQTDFAGNLGRDFRDLYRFYIDPKTRDRMESMGRIRRAFWLLGWLFKSVLLKLSPTRRVLLLLALVMAIAGWTSFDLGTAHISYDFRPWGFLLLLLVLMLELKDKVLAKDEIQVARQVQLALLPREHPTFPGWEIWSYSVPANDVGGDLVDYVELGPERLGIALGDVAGKGLGAALLAAKLQATLRALGPDSPSLDELGGRVNTILQMDGLPNRYATLFYVEMSPDSGHVRYLNAGHNPPFLLHRDSEETLGPSSFPLGMMPVASYEEGMLDMTSGEMLIAYSDGLTEAANPDGEEFGVDRLRAILGDVRTLPVEDAGRTLLGAVDGWLDGERPQDDLSVVVVRKS